MNVLVFRFSSLGDVALCLPALKSVLDRYPDAHITLVTRKSFFPLFEQLSRTKLVALDAKGEHQGLAGLFRLYKQLQKMAAFDAVVDLHNVLRTQVLRTFFSISGTPVHAYHKDRSGRKAMTRRKNKRRSPLTHAVQQYLGVFEQAGLPADLCDSPWLDFSKVAKSDSIGFAPLASNRQKTWPLRHSRRFLEEVSKKWNVELYGGPEERKRLHELAEGLPKVEVVAENGGLRAELQRMAQLRCMVAMDSANMHLAALLGVPTVSVWGATHSAAGFAPLGPQHEIVERPLEALPCRPCSIYGHKSCFRGDWACMEELPPSDVSKAVRKFMAE